MDIEILSVDRLRFSDGSPVRSASAVVAFGDGCLVVPDDATHAAWFREQTVTAVRLLPPVDGLEVFDEASGTKHLKPDLEAACQVMVDDAPAALIMGSGSSPARMRWSLLRFDDGTPRAVVADMTRLYAAVAAARPSTRMSSTWRARASSATRCAGTTAASLGRPRSASVDIDLSTALGAALGRSTRPRVAVTNARRYDLGTVDGVGLAVTDVVALPGGPSWPVRRPRTAPTPSTTGLWSPRPWPARG